MTEPEVTWPEGIRNDESVEAIVAYFTSTGYATCDNPWFEDGYLKIVIFAKDDYPTHTSRQLPSQQWTSKMGFDGVDIEHDDLECIAGSQYGTPSVFMKKPVTLAGIDATLTDETLSPVDKLIWQRPLRSRLK